MPERDWALKCHIEEVLRQFPSYGSPRIALALNRNHKPIERVMKVFGIKAYRRRGRRWKKPKVEAVPYPNLLMQIVPAYPHHAWVADFTHLSFKGRDIRVATTMDVFTRDIVGLAIGTRGGTVLVTQALWSALLTHSKPVLFHSDNGVEYNAVSFRQMLVELNIQISRSKKGCPWENGYQESWYDKFKVDLGDPNRFNTLGELVAEIYKTIHRYNTLRIHSALKMAPRQFALLHSADTLNAIVH
jgi:transposase InsO family protein